MTKRWGLVSGLAVLTAGIVMAATTAQPGGSAAATEGGPPAGYDLKESFQEEFNGAKPSQDWGHVFDDPGNAPFPIARRNLFPNAERQVYFDKDYLKLGIDPYAVHDGMMTITAAPMSPATKQAVMIDLAGLAPWRTNPVLRNVGYTSGMLSQRGRFSQQYGYFEARMRWTRGTGIWPAFWLLRQDSHWPPEIDIMEAIGKKPYEIYSSTHSSVGARNSGVIVPMHGSPQDFHRYGALWLPDRIDYYLDGVKTGTLPTHADMNQPMYMLLNLAIGGNWPGDPDANTVMPAKLDIDYVRAWRFLTPPAGAVLQP